MIGKWYNFNCIKSYLKTRVLVAYFKTAFPPFLAF